MKHYGVKLFDNEVELVAYLNDFEQNGYTTYIHDIQRWNYPKKGVLLIYSVDLKFGEEADDV